MFVELHCAVSFLSGEAQPAISWCWRHWFFTTPYLDISKIYILDLGCPKSKVSNSYVSKINHVVPPSFWVRNYNIEYV